MPVRITGDPGRQRTNQNARTSDRAWFSPLCWRSKFAHHGVAEGRWGGGGRGGDLCSPPPIQNGFI